MSHWFQPLPPKVSGPARDHPNRRWRPLYLDHATCAMTHVSGTSRHVNRPANVSHARSSAPAMTHIGWDRTAIGHRSAELCDMGGGSVINLLDGAEDHRRGALDRPAHQVPWAVAVMSQQVKTLASTYGAGSNSELRTSASPRSSASMIAQEWCATSRHSMSSACWASRRYRAPSSWCRPVVASLGA